ILFFGILIGVLPLAQFMAAPVLGGLSDIYGRKPVLAVSLAGTCISYLLFTFGILSRSLTILFVARILDGITGGNISVAQAAIADITPEKDRAKNFGLIGAAYGLGFITGPIIGGILSDNSIFSWFGVLTPFLIAAALIALDIIAIFLIFPETNNPDQNGERPSWLTAFTHIKTAYSMDRLRGIFVTNFLFQAGFAFFGTFLSIYLIHRFGFGQKGIGIYLAYGGIWIAFMQGVVARYVSSRFNDISIIRWSLLVGSFSILAYYFPHSIIGLVLIVPIFALGNGLAMAHLPALVSRRSPANIQGEVLGINMSVQSLAQAIPPILSGFLSAELTPETPVYVAGIVIFISWVVFRVAVKKG
ncbi:MAG: MFS transporter, partial [Patescibacteria group bacterium]|nr:MFS transporter [Patescibacteria group bacterium]